MHLDNINMSSAGVAGAVGRVPNHFANAVQELWHDDSVNWANQSAGTPTLPDCLGAAIFDRHFALAGIFG